jgi:opacity protein-like surface antigen
MVSFKALCLVGVAGLVATTTAHAADLLPPPPLPEAPAFQPASQLFSGAVYLRGDVGVGAADLRTRESSFGSGFDAGAAGVAYDARSLDDSAFVDAGVGYRFNQYFRADVTGEYRTSAHFSAIESYNDNTTLSGRQYDTYSGQYRSIVGLINGYVDLGTWWCVTPFFGAGVGVANVSVKNMYDVSPNGGFGTAPDHSQNNFAYALMAGLDFAVTPNLKLELGYRYLDMGNVSSGTFACANTTGGGCQEVQHSHLASNDIRLGFRYTFADYAPAPRPVIARY